MFHFVLPILAAAAGFNDPHAITHEPTPQHSVPELVKNVVWGGCWGLLFVFKVPFCKSFWAQAIAYGALPAAVQMLLLWPLSLPSYGVLGWRLGPFAPLYAIMHGLSWSVPAFTWYRLLAWDHSLALLSHGHGHGQHYRVLCPGEDWEDLYLASDSKPPAAGRRGSLQTHLLQQCDSREQDEYLPARSEGSV